MVVEQIVEIPPNRRLFVKVPREIPAGRTILTFSPAPAIETANSAQRMTAQDAIDLGLGFGNGPHINPYDALEQACGIAKRLGSKLTSEQSIAWRREEAAFESGQYRQYLDKNGDAD